MGQGQRAGRVSRRCPQTLSWSRSLAWGGVEACAALPARAGDRLHPPECGENGPPHHSDSDDRGDGTQGVPARRRRHQRVEQEAAEVGGQRRAGHVGDAGAGAHREGPEPQVGQQAEHVGRHGRRSRTASTVRPCPAPAGGAARPRRPPTRRRRSGTVSRARCHPTRRLRGRWWRRRGACRNGHRRPGRPGSAG